MLASQRGSKHLGCLVISKLRELQGSSSSSSITSSLFTPKYSTKSNIQTTIQDIFSKTTSKWRDTLPSSKTLDGLIPQSARQLINNVQQPGGLQRAISLQLESAWQRHHRKVIAGGVLLTTWLVWRSMRFTASAFVDLSTSLATTGLLALAASISMGGMWWLYRRHFIISPSAVYRAAMIRLNTHPGVLDIMGAPVVGSDVRATVLTGGGLKFKGLRPKLRSRRVQMIFPLHGSERRGLVSVEAKKRNGQLKTTLLAVDVPLPNALGGEQRVYIEGGPRNYSKSSVLDELRKPFLAALQSEDVADAEDDAEDAAEARQKEIQQVIEEQEVKL